MPFYKRDGDTLLSAPNFVAGPGFTLTADARTDHAYPMDGWYWFDTLDDALTNMRTGAAGAVTMRQAQLALLRAGLLAAVDDAIDSIPGDAGIEAQITWATSSMVERNNPLIAMMASSLGLTEAQVDALFAVAATL